MSYGFGIVPPQGIIFTDAEMHVVKEAKKKEMSQVVLEMNNNPIGKEKIDELARDLQFKFVEPVQEPKKEPAWPQSGSTEAPHKAMATGTLEPKKEKATAAPEV